MNRQHADMPDPQYQRLYKAQKATGLFKAADLFTTDDALFFLKGITESPWCRSRFGTVIVKVKPILVDAKTLNNLVATSYPYANVIVYSPLGLNKITTLHELAHLLNKRSEAYLRNLEIATGNRPAKKGHSSHGKIWAGIFLALVKEFQPDSAGVLESAFKEHGVRYSIIP